MRREKCKLANRAVARNFLVMSVAEIKEEIRHMNAADRAEVQRHLRLLKWSEDPETPKRLAAAHAAMDAGRKVTQEQVEAFMAGRQRPPA